MQSSLSNYVHAEQGIVLKLSETNLLLPDIMVEEMFWPTKVRNASDSPHWFLGYFDWDRGSLPLISFEKLNGLEGPGFSEGASVAIINGSVNHLHLPFYGLLVDAGSELVPLKKTSIAPEFGKQSMRAEACWTVVNNQSAVIPKVDWIEEHLLAYLLHR